MSHRLAGHIESLCILVAVAVVAGAGAVASRYVRNGGHWFAYYGTGMLSIGTWTIMARRCPWSLLTASIAWDIAYGVTYLGTMVVLLNSELTRGQVVGSLVAFVGLIIMGL